MAESTNTLEICGVFIAAALVMKNKRKKRNKAIWTTQWILNRPKYGAYHPLINELRSFDQSSYKNFLRMDVSTFENLLLLVSTMIKKKDTNMREAICPAERLALTLRFLATG